MKRILSILMILLIISMIVICPIAEDKPKAEGTDYGYLLAQFNPSFWVWFTQVISGMGMAASDLGTQLDYINRNGNIDEYFADLWEQFQTDVESNWGYATGYLKFTGQLWKDLFAGDPLRSIIGTKEIYEGSTDPVSPYYIDFANANNYYNGMKVWRIDQQVSPVNYFRSLTYEQARSVQLNYGITTYTTGIYRYEIDRFMSAMKWYIRFKKVNTSTLQWTELWTPREYLTSSNGSYVPVISYINPAGAPDQNGNIYRLDLLPVAHIMFDTNQMFCDDQYEPIIGAVNQSMLTDDAIDVEFDNNILDQTITQEDITPEDYVKYEIDRAYLEQIQDLITKISMNEDTQADWVLNPPQEVVRVETTNTVIREIIQAGDATIPVELDFPELQDLELPSALITKFPFCIPYDFYRFFQMLNAEPIAPEFTIPFEIGDVVDYDFVFNFDMFDDIIYIVRWFFLALFVLGLIMATRQMIKG